MPDDDNNDDDNDGNSGTDEIAAIVEGYPGLIW